MTRAGLILGLLALCAWSQTTTEVSGLLRRDTEWSGDIVMLEDVVVGRGTTLTIRPGTTVRFKFKGAGLGWNPERHELHVQGRLIARGRPDRPIRLGPATGPKEELGERAWLGIVFLPGRTEPSLLEWCVIEKAVAGVQVAEGNLKMTDCVLFNCGAGVGTALWADHDLPGPRTRDSAPLLERCRFAYCYVAVSIERAARPELRRCLVLDCPYGVAGIRESGAHWVHKGIGPVLERCEFTRCGVAVSGSSRVTNSIFTDNRLVYSSSNSHRVQTAFVDRFLRRHNLYWNNAALANDDVPLGDGPVMANPLRRGPVPERTTVAWLLSDLEPVLGLAKESPARAAATDCGGLGMFGPRGSLAPKAKPAKGGLALAEWLVRWPRGGQGPKKLPGNLRPGAVVDGSVWILARPDATNLKRAGADLTGRASKPRWAVAYVNSRAAREVDLLAGGDGQFRISVNERSAVNSQNVRRYDPEDFRVRVRLVEGMNLIAIRYVPRPRARLQVRLTEPGGRSAPAGVTQFRFDHDDGSKPLRVVSVQRTQERDRSGRRIDSFRLDIRFSDRVHWRDAMNPASYRLSRSGAPVPFPREARVAYDVAKKTVSIHGFRPARGTYRLTFRRFRDVFGRARELHYRPKTLYFK